LDYITDVYLGKLNPAASVKTRERIHWICKRAKKTDVLDVGCSQGITDILIAREGFHVFGVDISEETIESANAYRNSETKEVQARIKFEAGDFLEKEFGNQSFDSVIMSEVLEHLVQPALFVEKAHKLLREDGIFIVTVPFGIMDHPDHKGTFYLLDIMELIEPFFEINEVQIIDEWIAMTATKCSEKKELSSIITRDYVREMEKRVYIRERHLLTTIEKQRNNLDLKRVEAELKELKSRLKLKEQMIDVITANSDNIQAEMNKINMEILHLKCEAMLKDKELMKDVNNTRNIFEKTIRVLKKDGLKRVIYKVLKKLKLRK